MLKTTAVIFALMAPFQATAEILSGRASVIDGDTIEIHGQRIRLFALVGINPPSFYAAFGSKAELYSRILDRYAGTGAIPLFDLLKADLPVAECLVAVLEAAARRYAADPDAAGCLVIEGVRCTDREAREAAGTFLAAAEGAIHRFVAARHPDQAERVTDYMSTVMAGLSASARNGHDLDRLLAAARLAGAGLEQVVRG